jgi:hypothetical protein
VSGWLGGSRLIEAVCSAHRERDPRGAWEPALDPEGLSSTARAVLRLIEGESP